jgi:hypothetical protein
MLLAKTNGLSGCVHRARPSLLLNDAGRCARRQLGRQEVSMHLLNSNRSIWDQPDDRDHPALLTIIAVVGIVMFTLVCIYG